MFFMYYIWPTEQVFFLYLRRILDKESFWMLLNLDKIQKNSNFFFVKASLRIGS